MPVKLLQAPETLLPGTKPEQESAHSLLKAKKALKQEVLNGTGVAG